MYSLCIYIFWMSSNKNWYLNYCYSSFFFEGKNVHFFFLYLWFFFFFFLVLVLGIFMYLFMYMYINESVHIGYCVKRWLGGKWIVYSVFYWPILITNLLIVWVNFNLGLCWFYYFCRVIIFECCWVICCFVIYCLRILGIFNV